MIIREGKRKSPEKLMKEALMDRAERLENGTWDGTYQLSVFGGITEPQETEDGAANRFTYGEREARWFRIMDPQAIEDGGFHLITSAPEPYHYDVVLGTLLDVEVVERFEDCFGEARRNPACR